MLVPWKQNNWYILHLTIRSVYISVYICNVHLSALTFGGLCICIVYKVENIFLPIPKETIMTIKLHMYSHMQQTIRHQSVILFVQSDSQITWFKWQRPFALAQFTIHSLRQQYQHGCKSGGLVCDYITLPNRHEWRGRDTAHRRLQWCRRAQPVIRLSPSVLSLGRGSQSVAGGVREQHSTE